MMSCQLAFFGIRVDTLICRWLCGDSWRILGVSMKCLGTCPRQVPPRRDLSVFSCPQIYCCPAENCSPNRGRGGGDGLPQTLPMFFRQYCRGKNSRPFRVRDGVIPVRKRFLLGTKRNTRGGDIFISGSGRISHTPSTRRCEISSSPLADFRTSPESNINIPPQTVNFMSVSHRELSPSM